jgi:hypothetical protein
MSRHYSDPKPGQLDAQKQKIIVLMGFARANLVSEGLIKFDFPFGWIIFTAPDFFFVAALARFTAVFPRA